MLRFEGQRHGLVKFPDRPTMPKLYDVELETEARNPANGILHAAVVHGRIEEFEKSLQLSNNHPFPLPFVPWSKLHESIIVHSARAIRAAITETK